MRRGRLVLTVLLAVLIAACSGGGRSAAPAEEGAATASPPPSTEPAPSPTTTPEPSADPLPPAETPPPAPTPRATPTPSPANPSPPPPDSPPSLPASLRGGEWETLPTDRNVVALTFDAGANADAVDAILSALEAEDVAATFFLTGNWVQRYPEAARRIGQAYPVGNHTATHPELTTLGAAALRAEVVDAERAIRSATGRDPRPLFRFPFGDRDARTIAAVNELGYGSIRWTVDSLGWRGTSGGMTADGVVERVLATLRPGQIVLLHVGSHPQDGSMLDAEALPELITAIRDRGYEFTTVAVR